VSAPVECERSAQGGQFTFPVVVEVFEKLDQLDLVPAQNGLDLGRLLRVRNEHLPFQITPNHRSAPHVIQQSSHIRLTLKTWKASNWMFLLLSLRRFIIILRLSSSAI